MTPDDWRPPVLGTARLVLRPVADADVDAVFAACSDPRLTEHALFPTHQTPADSQQFLDAVVRPSYAAGVPNPWAVCRREAADRLIGCVGGWPVPPGDHQWEVGYWLAVPLWGQGLMTEAVAAVVPHLFARFPAAERVQARVLDGNPASDRLLVKCGFLFEGTLRRAAHVKGRLRDLRMYSRLRGEGPSG